MYDLLQPNIDKEVAHSVADIARKINATAIITIEECNSCIKEENIPFKHITVSIFKKTKEKQFKKYEYPLSVKIPDQGLNIRLREVLNTAIMEKMLDQSDTAITVQDSSLGLSFKSVVTIFEVKDLFFDVASLDLHGFNKEVVENILDIALEIARRGREGKKIGTAFILGKEEEIVPYAKQLVLNPFENANKNITDKEIRETIKEFSQLDGAFMINSEGKILSAGTYLDIDSANLYLPAGFGTRHRCCAAITHKTNALAILVSESGGVVKVFKKGKVIQIL